MLKEGVVVGLMKVDLQFSDRKRRDLNVMIWVDKKSTETRSRRWVPLQTWLLDLTRTPT